ncbi:GGDEF domain-containing protein [Thiomicrospira pelophila]|uniref:GGDEF domain-containing protein n=1 Tax=Thiomicrospira pelophila TaxID=934 RepID=UPI0006894E46|nr:GGDEF domain-containing protein [Thiomicrospira pelophila]
MPQPKQTLINKPTVSEKEVERLLAYDLYSKALGTVYTHAIFGLIFVFLFYSKVPSLGLIVWGGILAINISVRFVFIRYWLGADETTRQKSWMKQMSLVTSLVNGVLWGMTVFFLDFEALPFESLAVSIMVFGLAAGSAVYAAYFLPAFYLSSVPYLGSYMLYHFEKLTYESMLMVVILAVFALMLYEQARQLNFTHRKNIMQRLENDQLIESLKESNLGFKKASNTDFLTGIHNRRHFDEMIKRVWKTHLIDEKPVSIIMCDIDDFKDFNDQYGHQSGDKVLVDITQLIIQNVGYSDALHRYGGEEFILILPETGLTEATELAEHLRQKIEAMSFDVGQSEQKITMSFGVSARTPFNMNDYVELIAEADAMLYKSKENGRNRVSVKESLPV